MIKEFGMRRWGWAPPLDIIATESKLSPGEQVICGEFMTDEKEFTPNNVKPASKPKQSGMALEMDIIKKIAHQLERAPANSSERIVAFVRDWAGYRTMTGDKPSANGQLPLAAKDEFPE